LIFSGLKQITNTDTTGSLVKKLIQNRIALYCAHTNLDIAENGINDYLSKKLQLNNTAILEPVKNHLFKIVTFVPHDHADNVREALFNASAGTIGNYDSCSYNIEGTGTFRGNELTNPFTGEKEKLHFEPETRIETIVEKQNLRNAIESMLKAHPYEEVAYDIYQLENNFNRAGIGRIGDLPSEMLEKQLIEFLKEKLNLKTVSCSKFKNRKIKKIAICSGSGSAYINKAVETGATAFITGDIKHHTFIDNQDKIFIVDIGHYESEKFSMNIFYEILLKKFTTFAVFKSNNNINPINYI